MSGLQRQGERAFIGPVKGHAHFDEVQHPGWAFFGDEAGDDRVNETGARRNRIGSMRLCRVERVKGGRESALRPGRGGRFTEWGRGDNGAFARGEPQCEEQASKARADDEDIVARARFTRLDARRVVHVSPRPSSGYGAFRPPPYGGVGPAPQQHAIHG